MNNLQADGWSLDDLKYVQLPPGDLPKYRLLPGDIVINRTNSKELVGKCGVFRESGDWVFASYLMRLKVNAELAVPEFISAFLDTRAGRVQIDRESRQIIGMTNINAEEVRSIRVPLPSISEQEYLLHILDVARQRRDRMRADATSLLEGMDEFVLGQLSLTLPPKSTHRTTYAMRLRDVAASGKLYPDYFHPERTGAIQAIARGFGTDYSVPISGIVEFHRDQRQVQPADSYLGLANVQPNTGERCESTEKDGKGMAFEFSKGDVLFARLRPYLNKVYVAEHSGVCSTEFHVMRVRRGSEGSVQLMV